MEKENFRIQLENNFWNQFSNFFGNSFLCDYFLEVEEKVIPGHKAILASRSGYFESLFRWNPQEAKTRIHEFSVETFNSILMFLYTNKLELLNLQNEETTTKKTTAATKETATKQTLVETKVATKETRVATSISEETTTTIIELLKVGQYFQMNSLIHQCEQFIIAHSDISISNVCLIWNLAKEHKVDHVSEACKLFFIQNFTACSTFPGFLQLHKDSLKSALNAGQISAHESIIFEALKKWSQSTSLPIDDLLPPQTLFNKRIKISLMNDRRSLLEILTS